MSIAIISALEDPELARNLLNNGASGYIPKSTSNEILSNAVRLIISGGVYIPPFVLARDASNGQQYQTRTPAGRMTPRQKDVLELMNKGYSNKEIAENLNLSISTVKAHTSAILTALGVKNRTQAANQAIKIGLIKER